MKKKIFMILATVGILYSVTRIGNPVDAQAQTQTNQAEKLNEGEPEPAIISGGSLDASGSGVDGLDLYGGGLVTTGVIDFHYDGWTLGLGGLDTKVDYVMQMPEEFSELAKTSDFLKSLSATFQSNGGTVHHYKQSDFHIESGGTVLRISNAPAFFWVVGEDLKVELSMDLGNAVTESGVRIPDATNGSSYEFLSGIVEEGAILDWDLIGSKNASYTLPTNQLDPGWRLSQEKPTIEQVYDIDTIVRGSGTVGAAIELRVGSSVIGKGSVSSTGIYTIEIPTQAAGTTISAYQNNGIGWSEPASTIVKHKEAEIPVPIIDEPVYEDDTIITGRGYMAGDKITITDKSGNELGVGLVKADLTFAIIISAQPAYSVIYVVESNATGDTSPKSEAVIHEREPSETDKITSLDTYSLSNSGGFLNGTYSGTRAALLEVEVDGVSGGKVAISPGGGQFTYWIEGLVTGPNQIVKVLLLDESSSVLDSRILTITQ
ncbi:hypothetical protein IGI37_000213 [Enterococcus sp. AZ194]|uniref:Ig-like domain-containing protein n=1 Tax=Enterococcus sp. AZ194 TaxID=2774629 RepID=UPI003F24A327